ncbi:MAG: hypothetical protein ABI806_27370 [Candidatus Solibacter sp.]
MLVYPQLESGALTQFPVLKTRRARTVINRASDGSTIRIADPAAETTEWVLVYEDLSDAEAAALRSFFDAAEGTLQGFTFLDPAGNLLAFSDQLGDEIWQRDPLLTSSAGIADPKGGTAAWELHNQSGGDQRASQTLVAPGDYQYCFSAYVRSAAPMSIAMSIAGRSAAKAVTTEWTRVSVTGQGNVAAESVHFSIAVPAGATVEVFGLQAEAQCAASSYMASTRGGVYENAHLGEDVLTISRTSENRHSCTVKIIHANHL